MKLLVAVSSDAGAGRVIGWVRQFCEQLRAPCELVCLHVVPTPALGSQGVMEAEVAGDLAGARAAIAEALAGRIETWSVRLEAGDPGRVICEQARGFDLVILGTHRRSQLSELVFGGVSAYVIHHAPCPVVVV